MTQLDSLQQRRTQILESIRRLGPMRPGTLIDQYLTSTRADGSSVKRGPYVLYTCKEGGKTVSRRIKDPAVREVYAEQIANFRSFQTLTAELAQVGQALADHALAHGPEVKKKRSRP